MLAAATAALSVVTASITDCSTPDSLFKISRLAIRPDPPVPGLPVALDLEFMNTGPEITLANAGVASTSITLNGLPYSYYRPLCDDTACPIVVGYNNRTGETAWPDFTGKLVSTIRWSNAADAELLCIQTTLHVGERPRLRAHAHRPPALQFPFSLWKHYHLEAPKNSTMCNIFPDI